MTDDRTDEGGESGDRDGETADGSGTGRTDSPLSLNALLEILAHHHRREILRVLIESPNDGATIDELTARLSRLEAERTGVKPGQDQLETALHHVHLPKLTDAGLVEYDARSTAVRYRSHDRLEDLLEGLEATESS